MTDKAVSDYSMTCELQSTREGSGIEWPALRNHITCMVHIIQLALGAFISSLSVKGCTKSWEAHECNQQFGENESIDIGKSQRLRKEGNARIDKVSAMSPGLAKIIETVRISRYYESLASNLHRAENSCCIDYADTWSSTEFLDSQKATVHITVLPILDVKTRWHWTLELLVRAHRLREFTCEWL